MLRKLFKYDFRAVGKFWWVAALISVALSVVGGVCLRIATVEHTTYHLLQTIAILGCVLAFIGISVFVVLSLILVLVRFYRHFFTDEGYLTFTLPVKKSTLINSKLMTSLLFSILTELVFLADFFTILAIGIPKEIFNPVVWREILRAISHILQELGGYSAVYLAEGLVFWLVSGTFSMLLLFICITIAAMIAKKHKILAAIGTYYAINTALNIVMQATVFQLTFSFVNALEALSQSQALLVISLVLLAGIGIFTALAAGAYLLESYLFERKLNLV